MSATRISPVRTLRDATAGVPPRPRRLTAVDPVLALAALGLVAFSLITLRGATRTTNPGHPLYYVERQGLYALLGLVAAIVVASINPTRWRRYRYWCYGAVIAGNVLVYGTPTVLGAHRWFPLPFFQVQPSEFGKVLLIVALASFAFKRARRLHEWRTTSLVMLLALVAAMVVIPQPDLGTGMVFVSIGATTLFVGGTPWKHLVTLAVMFAAAVTVVLVIAPDLGVHVLKPYQVQRLTGFLHPSHDPGNQTYNITQSLTAIGSGGKTGTGVAGATQAQLGYLPEKQTDFIFAVVGETYGFAGAAVVLSLYALVIWRSLRILTAAENLYGTLIAGGILGMLMFQVFVNVGMTIGIMPITGVPLPLMSYGGSSVLVTFVCLGLLQAIHIHARLAAAGKGRLSL